MLSHIDIAKILLVDIVLDIVLSDGIGIGKALPRSIAIPPIHIGSDPDFLELVKGCKPLAL